MNELINQIDMIQESTDLTEIEVVNSMIDAYTKASMIIESADESTDTSSFSIFQELDTDTLKNAFNNFMYTDGTKPHGKPGESILKKVLLFIPRLFMMFLRQLVKFIVIIIQRLVIDIQELKNDKYRYVPIDNLVLANEILDPIDNLIYLFKKVHDNLPQSCTALQYYSIINTTVINLSEHERIPTEKGYLSNATIPVALEEFSRYIKQYDDGPKHKDLFKENALHTPSDQQRVTQRLKLLYSKTVRSVKGLITRLNKLNKEFKQMNEQGEDVGPAYSTVNEMRSNLAYILQFMAKISKTASNYSNNHKLHEWKDPYRYDADEFDDNFDEEES